jgi:hypothetical protein
MEKQGGFMRKKYLIGILILFSVFTISLVSAAGESVGFNYSNASNLRNYGNYTTRFNLSVYSNVINTTGPYNVTLYCNKSGGAVDTRTGADVVQIVTLSNRTAGGAQFETAYVNISFLSAQGNESRFFNCSLYADNKTTQFWSAAIKNITFDSTPPNVTTIYTVVNNGNYSGIINLNITVNDALMEVGSVYFNITNSTGQVSFIRANNLGGGIYYNLTINTLDYLDGKYNITVYANDTLSNLNSTERLQGTVDNTVPTGSLSCSPLDSEKGDTVTCTCSGEDATSGVSSGPGSSNPSTSQTGDFTEFCTIFDYAGNSITVSAGYSVHLQPSSSHTPSSSSHPSTTIPNGTINDTTPESTTTNSETNPQTTGEEQQTGMVLGISYWIWIIITLAILAVIFGGRFLFSSKKKRK